MDALSPARQQTFDVDSPAIPDAACANALPSGTRLQGFEILSPLGQGGFSIVYQAMDTALQRPVAVKEYMPSSFASRADSSQVILRSQRHKTSFDAGLSSFIDEARLLAQFKHPSLVEVLSFWEENGTAYMAMPLYSGKTLRQTLRDHPRCAHEALLKSWIGPVLDVLEMLHEQQVFHRDIAPDNIIIQPDGSPVLLDLGSARKVATDNEHAPTVVVKAGYAPIEQYAEDKSVPQGPWTDIYALGALLYYAVTGRPPSASVSRMMKDSLVLLSDQQPAGYSKGFLAAIDHALALQPADRPQSIGTLREALDIQNLALSQVSPTTDMSAGTTAEYDDEEKTVILSAQELEVLLSGEARPAPPASDDEYEHLFDAQPQPDANAHAFADMEELLNPPRAPSHGRLSVPDSRVEPASKKAVTAAPDKPADTGPGQRSDKSLLLAGIAGVLVIGGLLAAVMLPGQGDDEADTGDMLVTEVGQPAPADVTPAMTVSADAAVPPSDAAMGNPDMAILFGADTPTEPLFVDSLRLRVEEELGISGGAGDPAQALPIETGSSVLAPLPEIVTVQLDSDAGADEAARNPSTAQAQPQTRTTPTASRESASNRAQPARPATPARAPVAAADTGKIALNILPWGEVWVDGTLRGVTPPLRTLELPVGRRNIEIRNPGFASLTHSINVTAQATPEIVHEFISGSSHRNLNLPVQAAAPAPVTPAAPVAQRETRVAEPPRPSPRPAAAASPVASTAPIAFGYTEIRVRPWAEVWVNGELKGVAPPLNELRLPEGLHTIEFRNPDYPTARRAVKVSSAARSTLVQFFD